MGQNPLEEHVIEQETVHGFMLFVAEVFPDEYAVMVLLAQSKYSRAAQIMLGSSRKLVEWTKDMHELYALYNKADDGDEEAQMRLADITRRKKADDVAMKT